MKTSRNLIALASSTLMLAATANTEARYGLIHSFDGSANDGGSPYGSLTLVGSDLYGMASEGGTSDNGTIFQLNSNGHDYTTLYSFGTVDNDGASPYGSLTLVGSNLYGMAYSGGDNDNGTIFQISTDGSGYTNLYSFGTVDNDGANPNGSLTLVGSTLFGMTYSGGDNNNGTIFQINTDGSGYTNLYSFGTVDNDGANPYGSLTLVGSILFGMTSEGGTYSDGTIFQINTDGSGYTNLYSFGTVDNDGANPEGDVTLVGSTLFGMANNGGIYSYGTIFQINTDGSGYTNLYSFGIDDNDGANPYGDVTLVGSNLFGMTSDGGINSEGTIFGMNIDGSGYTNLYTFGTVNNDGAYPNGDVTLAGSTLFGMTSEGGTSNNGVIFSLSLPSLTATGPGQFTIKKFQATVNLDPAKTNLDTWSLTATPPLGLGFSVTNQTVTVDVGGAQATFSLNAKGSSKSSTNSCDLTYTKKTEVWTLTASMKKGSWATDWAGFGVTNATTPKAGMTVTLPVSVTVGTNTFATEESLQYKATEGKSGTLR